MNGAQYPQDLRQMRPNILSLQAVFASSTHVAAWFPSASRSAASSSKQGSLVVETDGSGVVVYIHGSGVEGV
jgi:hypothetical protein